MLQKLRQLSKEQIIEVLLLIILLILPFREILAHFLSPVVKMIPDLLVIGIFFFTWIKDHFRLKFAWSDWFFLGFLVLAFISTVFVNHVGISSFILQTRSISIYYVLYFSLRNLKLSKEFYSRFMRILKYIIYAVVFLAVLEKIFDKMYFFPTEWASAIEFKDNFIRTYGVFNNPNTFGAFLLFSYIISRYYENISQKKYRFYYYGIILLGVILTVSRSAILLFGCYFVLSFGFELYENWRHHEKRYPIKHNLLQTGFALILSVALATLVTFGNSVYYDMTHTPSDNPDGEHKNPTFFDRFDEMMSGQIVDKSNSDGRLYNITHGFEIALDSPWVGMGFGTYGDAASLMNPPEIYEKYGIKEGFYSDNEYIKVIVENGAFGVILYAGFIFCIFWKLRKHYYKLIAFLMFLGFGMFYNVFEIQILSFLFWFYLMMPDREEKHE